MVEATLGNARFFAEVGHIPLQLLRKRHAVLRMKSNCSSKVWPLCKRLAPMR